MRTPANHLRGLSKRPLTTHERPWHRDTSIIHALVPIAPGWTVYALFEHFPPDFDPFGPRGQGLDRPPVVEQYPVAAWADVELRWFQRDNAGQPSHRSHCREWQAMIATYSGWEMCTTLSIAEYLHTHEGFVTCALVGPGQRLPDWVESPMARAAFIADQKRADEQDDSQPKD